MLDIEQESPTRGKRQLDNFLQKHQDQLEDSPAEGPRILDPANSMLTTLQKMVKEMDMSTLKVCTPRHLPKALDIVDSLLMEYLFLRGRGLSQAHSAGLYMVT